MESTENAITYEHTEIQELDIPSREQAVEFIKELKAKYPYAILHGTGYRSTKYILHLYSKWGDFLTEQTTEDGRKYKCCNCTDGLCDGHKKEPSWDSSPGILSDRERCFGEQFWAEVYEAKDHHFVDQHGRVLSFTEGEGGFGGRRYTVELEDGTVLKDIGLWHRGTLPQNLEGHIQKGTVF